MMSKRNQNIPELDGRLAKATNEIRDDPVSEDLVARCRSNALAIEGNTVARQGRQHSVADWIVPLAVAATVLVAINIGQVIALMPAADRQITAVMERPDGQRHLLYSDRCVEPILTVQQ